jgi:hypothetical protein
MIHRDDLYFYEYISIFINKNTNIIFDNFLSIRNWLNNQELIISNRLVNNFNKYLIYIIESYKEDIILIDNSDIENID